ncbi:mechanosensitive ion channel [Microbacter sp. GSS18]|nr:mechanosensitive ion channel [Microbacter sp. GSS18]
MWDDWLSFIIVSAISLGVALAVMIVITYVIRFFARKYGWPDELARRARRPFRWFVLMIGVWVAVAIAYPEEDWGRPFVTHMLAILAMAVLAWLLIALVMFGTDLMLQRFRVDVEDNSSARKIHTQVMILRRLAIALIIIIVVASALLSFPAVQTIGASLLASAGIASIVAGLAAQSTLSNMFAGVQLVFSDALRVDDVVVVEGEWGRVGEITLSYVVVDIWDQRKLVLPCTYFTTKPFQNWTRNGAEVLGTVELDVDWRVPIGRIRERLAKILSETELWDGRTQVVQATDATGGLVQVRILISAPDSGKLWDLRCIVREELIEFVQSEAPYALPVQRVMMDSADENRRPREAAPHEGMFSGSAEAEERHRQFTQAHNVVEVSGNLGEGSGDGGDGDG